MKHYSNEYYQWKKSIFIIKDDEVLASIGVTDFDKYKVNPKLRDTELMPDFFVWN